MKYSASHCCFSLCRFISYKANVARKNKTQAVIEGAELVGIERLHTMFTDDYDGSSMKE